MAESLFFDTCVNLSCRNMRGMYGMYVKIQKMKHQMLAATPDRCLSASSHSTARNTSPTSLSPLLTTLHFRLASHLVPHSLVLVQIAISQRGYSPPKHSKINAISPLSPKGQDSGKVPWT